MTTVLQTEGLTRRFGRLVAVDHVDLEIDADEITSIIGPNGAGKTTFYNLLTGTLKPTEGTVRLRPRDGTGLQDVTGLEPYELNRLGLSRAYQISNVFENLSVLENIRFARVSFEERTMDLRSFEAHDAHLNDGAWDVIELTNLKEVAETNCANLSHGDKRKVEIALALATDPSIVLLDEPTAGMNRSETRRMVELIEDLDDQTDTTFLVTEHDMEVILGISDRVIVLDRGELIASGSPDEVVADEHVREAYLGGEA